MSPFRRLIASAVSRVFPFLRVIPGSVGAAIAAVIALIGMVLFYPEGDPADVFQILTQMWGN